MDYGNFCSEILKNDPKIRFASVFDEWAKPVGGGMRDGIKNLLSEHMQNELVNLSILHWKARRGRRAGALYHRLGDRLYPVVQYGRQHQSVP